MSMEKNKSAILVIIALVVVCLGSFIGVSAIAKSDDALPTANTTLKPTQPSQHTQATTSGDMPAIVITTSDRNTEDTTEATTEEKTTAEETTAETTTKPSTSGQTTSSKPSTSSNPTTGNQLIDQENGAIFDNGLGGYQYDPEGNYYYTSSDPWQRQGGYNELYDLGAPFVSIYMDTMRLKFEYGGKDWLIQFWKGQYGYLFIGNEIGVYTKPTDRSVEHYDAASNEDALYMSMTGYRNGEEIYTREYGKYWWCTGFIPGRLESFADRSEISVACRITAKDYAMLVSICGALKENGYVLGENFTTSGLDVYITW